MKRTITLILLGFQVLSITSSCKKYLDVKPDQRLVVPSTLQDLQALLDQPSLNNTKTPSWDEASADNYYLTEDVYNSMSIYKMKAYLWEDYNADNYPNDWSRIYDAIYNPNVVLEGIGKIARNNQNQEDWDNLKGSALFLRALSYHRAAILFCKAYDPTTANQDYGIVLRQTSDFNISSQRSTLNDTYTKTIDDLKASVDLLPSTPKHVLRPSKPAALALLARVYLSMRMYDSSFKYASLSLSINNSLMDYNTDTDPNNLLFPITQFNKETLFSSILESYIYTQIYPLNARVDTTLLKSYQNDDLRKDVFYLDMSLLGESGYIFQGTYDGTFTNLFVGIATDEVWLMRAECNARLGNKDAALADLNTLMIKRWRNNGSWLPFTASTTQEALNIILTERRKELVFRGLRWMDIKRLNKENENITLKRVIGGQTYILPPNDLRYALLIPNDIINLTGIPQNPR